MGAFSRLDPRLRPWANELYRIAVQNGLQPRITSTFRSIAEQKILFDRHNRGESDLPAAAPGCSQHNYGLAFDLVSNNNEWLGSIWESWGGRWGGRFRDPPHFDVGAKIIGC